MVTHITPDAARLMHPDALRAMVRRYGPLWLVDPATREPVCLDCERPTDPGELCADCRCCTRCCPPPHFTRG